MVQFIKETLHIRNISETVSIQWKSDVRKRVCVLEFMQLAASSMCSINF